MRVLRTVVEIPVLPVLHTGPELSLRRTIAFEFIRDDDPRHVRETLEEFPEELRGRLLPSPLLYQDIRHVAVLVHRPPEIMPFAVDREKDFIQMPLVARARSATTELVGIGLAELPAPVPHGFVGQGDPACSHQLLGVPIAEAEVEVKPHTVRDDF
jgi:hypothetical protein